MKHIEFVLISKDDFLQNDSKELFVSDEQKNSFGCLVYNECKFKISWHSQLIQPEIKKISEDKYSIGIDQNFVILNLKICKICKIIHLDYFFYEVQIYNDLVFVITEMEIIILDNQFETIKKIELPNIFDSLSFENNYVLIKCIDEEKLRIAYDKIFD